METKFLENTVEFKIDFFEVDSMRIVWHGNYINYFERARCAFLDKIGYNYLAMEESGYIFPVTEVKCKYVKSLHFGDMCRARAILVEYENMIKFNFELYNAKTGELTTKGSVSQMCIDAKTGETQFVCPQIWRDKVEKCIKEGGLK
ncbi:MAG: acyl-CoA thioesterase [Treponema sp.]|nr:acyl-CoA thioesterase [Treponema sp.]MBR0487340.1 acyl-CoA thioesterase [Treponema sp.]